MIDWDLIARRMGYGSERSLLEVFYLEHQLSTKEIGLLLHVSRSFVCQRLQRYGIIRRTRGGANNDKETQQLLWLLDPRDVWLRPKELSEQLDLGLSTIYRLRKENLPQ